MRYHTIKLKCELHCFDTAAKKICREKNYIPVICHLVIPWFIFYLKKNPDLPKRSI